MAGVEPTFEARKRGSVGKPACGEIRIMGPVGEFLPAGGRGEIVLKGPHVFKGYDNDAEANAAAFVDGWFCTGDEGFFDAEGYLTLTGRIKETINRGGEKISPAEVDEAILSHAGVRDAATFPVPHPTLGEEVAAAVVTKEGIELTAKELRAHALERISGFKVPKRFVFVENIPKDDLGKVQRYRLTEDFGANVAPGKKNT